MIGLVILALGLALVVVGVRGTQGQTFNAVTGHDTGAKTADYQTAAAAAYPGATP